MANAIYLVVDENLSDIAGLQAQRIARQWECDVHIFVERRNAAASVRQFQATGRIHYHFDELTKFLPRGLPEDIKWPKIVYLRIFAPHILKAYQRLLYIDADILSMRSDKSIWELPLPSGLAAASDTATINRAPADLKNVSRRDWLDDIGVKSERYLNSGVLLIDPGKWLPIAFPQKLTSYFLAHPNATRFDQDFLSWVFDGSWTELGPRFNHQTEDLKYGLTEALEPVFIHFCGSYKPWRCEPEEWRAAISPIYHEIYRNMIREAGLDTNLFRHQQRVKLSKRIKYRFRAWLSSIGLQSRVEKRARAKWQRCFKEYSNFVENGLATGRFADETRTYLGGRKYPPIFDGRFVLGSDSRQSRAPKNYDGR